MDLRRAYGLVALLGVLTGGCAAAGPAQPPPASVALGAPPAAVEHPVGGAQLAPGARYRFPDVMPGRLDVDFTAPNTPIYSDYEPYTAYLSEDDVFQKVILDFQPVGGLRVFTDPYARAEVLADEAGYRAVTAPAPDDLLGYFARLPFFEVVQPERPVQVGGVAGRAVDLRIPDLPPEADCGLGLAECVNLFALPQGRSIATGEVSTEAHRMIILDLPSGPLLINQYLDSPIGEDVLGTVSFVERPLPAALGPARYVPFGESTLTPDQRYGTPALAGTVTAAFTSTTPVRAGVLGDELALSSPDRDGDHLYLAPTTALRGPAPGTDPRLQAPGPGQGSPLPVDPITWLTDQGWAQVVAGPTDTVVDSLPARSVEVRLTDAAPTVPCDLDVPDTPSCTLVLVNGVTSHAIVVNSAHERTLRLIEITAGGSALTLITSGPGATVAGTLQLEPR